MKKVFLYGQTPEHKEHFVKKSVELSEEEPFILTKYLIESEMANVYVFYHLGFYRIHNYALEDLTEILKIYNRKIEYNRNTNNYIIEKQL